MFHRSPEHPDLKRVGVECLELAASLGRWGQDFPVELLGGESPAMLELSDGDGHVRQGIQTAKNDHGVCLAEIIGSQQCAETWGVCAIRVQVKTIKC